MCSPAMVLDGQIQASSILLLYVVKGGKEGGRNAASLIYFYIANSLPESVKSKVLTIHNTRKDKT